VVLARGEDEHGFAVEEGEDGGLGAFELLFDDDGRAGVSEGPFDHDGLEGGEGFVGGGGDDDALALGEPGGLDDVEVFAGFEEGFGGFVVGEGPALGGRDGGLAHDVLGVGLVGLEACGGGGGPEDGAGRVGVEVLAELVGVALGEGVLGADDDEPDVAGVAEALEAVDLADGDGDVDGLSERCDAGVGGVGGVERAEAGRAGDGLGEGVLASAAADEEDVGGLHGVRLGGLGGRGRSSARVRLARGLGGV
jgi:hypothetical protein